MRGVVTVSLAHFFKREGLDFGKVRCNMRSLDETRITYTRRTRFSPREHFQDGFEIGLSNSTWWLLLLTGQK